MASGGEKLIALVNGAVNVIAANRPTLSKRLRGSHAEQRTFHQCLRVDDVRVVWITALEATSSAQAMCRSAHAILTNVASATTAGSSSSFASSKFTRSHPMRKFHPIMLWLIPKLP
jgi:hypothetical protein